MSRTSPSYGRRGRLNEATSGIRCTSPTYGKAKYGSYCEKAEGHVIVESDAERVVTQLLSIDPRVRAFRPQPFCVDLIDQRLLFTPEAMREARRKHSDAPGPRFYTADFSVDWQDGLHHAVEVKAERFEGDDAYRNKIERARPVLAANSYPLRSIIIPANTAHPIRMNARLLKQATHHVRTWLTGDLVERVTRRCQDGPVALGALCSDLAISPAVIPVLLAGGVLAGDLANHPLCGTFELSLAYGDLDHLCLLEGVEK
ncbi:conserved hypothetical protein [Burkholderia sp. H160]|nr:conserved hypothetical protein [Burkholderia sp. H160]